MAEYCLKCREEPRTVSGMHSCRGYKTVMDPAEYRSFLQASASNPLDRLSVGDLTTIYEGKDEADAVFRRAEEQFEESNARYFQEPLVYRFEFESISAVSGFRPSFDGSAILTEGHADKDWDGVLEFINTMGTTVLILLDKNETYVCRLVSYNGEGRKYMWGIKELTYQNGDRWAFSEWT